MSDSRQTRTGRSASARPGGSSTIPQPSQVSGGTAHVQGGSTAAAPPATPSLPPPPPPPPATATQIANPQPTQPIQVPQGHNIELSEAVGPDTRLPAVEMGAIELLTFFPNHTQWPDVHLRLKSHGWSSQDMAKVCLYARGYGSKSEVDRRAGALRHQVIKVGKHQFGPTFKDRTHKQATASLDITYNAATYKPLPGKDVKADLPKLYDLARGVSNFPVLGNDRGLVTQAILWAMVNDAARKYDISHIAMLARVFGWTNSAELSSGLDIAGWDARALARVQELMEALGYTFK